ncbi:MAG: glutaminyl-peptide cyclotransferase [Balneolaceae bacterium]
MKRICCIFIVLLLLLFRVEPGAAQAPSDDPMHLETEVLNIYPHDSDAFTQGLIYLDGFLYESTGRLGHSTLRKVQLETGKVLQSHFLDEDLFGEGLAAWNGRLIQLTLFAEQAYVYDRETYDLLEVIPYDGEGWGLATDGDFLVMSDGSPVLRYLQPETFEVVRQVTVTDQGEPLERLNELEMVEGFLFTNVLFEDRIAIIDPASGVVTAWLNLEGLLAPGEESRRADVLNGIAYDQEQKRLFVTGKLWPKLFEVRIPDLSRVGR